MPIVTNDSIFVMCRINQAKLLDDECLLTMKVQAESMLSSGIQEQAESRRQIKANVRLKLLTIILQSKNDQNTVRQELKFYQQNNSRKLLDNEVSVDSIFKLGFNLPGMKNESFNLNEQASQNEFDLMEASSDRFKPNFQSGSPQLFQAPTMKLMKQNPDE